MSRSHRPRPTRPRRREPGYHVDVWRSVAVLITDDPPLPDNARRLLAYSLVHIFSQDPAPNGLPFPAEAADPDAFIASLRDLHAHGFMGIEDGRAFLAVPGRDALGQIVAERVPREQLGDLAQVFLRSPDD